MCGTALMPDASECPHCGARVERTSGPVDQLLVGLDDLTRTAGAELARAGLQSAPVERAVGEFETAEDLAGATRVTGEDRADLSAFVQHVTDSGFTRDLAPIPARSPWASPVVGAGAVLIAAGLFLSSRAPWFGTIAILGGAAAMGAGSVLYRSRPTGQ